MALTGRFGEELRRAEVLVRAVADLSLAGRPSDLGALRDACGDRWWLPTITAEAMRRAHDDLQDAAVRWDALAPDEPFAMAWTRPPARAMVRP